MESKIRIIKIPHYSDGSAKYRPTGAGWHIQRPANLWLSKLAEGWMEHRGEAVKGLRYYLDRLPAGYEVYEKRRDGSAAVDKRLFGFHRSYFDSPNRFLPHFIHLMESRGSNSGCPCTICARTVTQKPAVSDGGSSSGSAAPAPSTAATRGRPFGRGRGRGRGRGGPLSSRPAVAPQVKHVDEEGTEDVYSSLLDKLQKQGHVDEPIEEDMSMDWRVEREPLRKQLANASEQAMYLPRLGEVVLFVRFPTPGRVHRSKWEAGVVAQTPGAGPTDIDAYQVNYTGYRIEPLPDPNSKDKRLSKQSKYVPVTQIRPLSLWKVLLGDVPQSEWHATIRNALTAMSTLSLLDKHHFSGSWPVAEISCNGLFIGSELVLVGDIVRLMPSSRDQQHVTDVLRVTSIKLKLFNLDADEKGGAHSFNTAVHITGKAYTTGGTHAIGPVDFRREGLQDFAGYAKQWYRRHKAAQSLQVPFSRILGRLWETHIVDEWLPDGSAGLSIGLDAVREARAYSARHLHRIPDGRTWFWADSRVEALDLETLNGEEVAAHDEERDPKMWRRQIKVLKGEAGERERQALKEQQQRAVRGRDHGNSMISAAMRAADSDDVSAADSDSDHAKGRLDGSRLVNVVTLDSSEEEEEEDNREDIDAQVAQQLADNIALPMDDEMLDDSQGSEESREGTPSKRLRFY